MTNDHQTHDEKAKQTIINDIQKYGCHLVLINADNYLPSFIYTIGLFEKFGHPEIMLFGLKADVMARILNYACDLIKKGEKLTVEKKYPGFLEGYKIQFIEVNEELYPNYLGYAGWYYNNFDFPALEIIWPDKQSRFPWDTDFNPDWKFKQPLLNRNTDFKFYESRTLGVYTTKQAFEGEPILYVYHNDNGDWQFHTSAYPNLDDSRLVCLEEITKLDPTINEIYHLQFGWSAWRETQNDDWQYAEDSSEDD